MELHDEISETTGSLLSTCADRLRGVLLPFPTPFRADDETVDHDALRRNLERWHATRVGGYIALGSTGERVHLDEGECLRVIETTRAATPTNKILLVGVGQQSTRATIAEARRAADAGADALLVITPNFYRGALNTDALVEYYAAVADRAPVPVLLYNIPQNTGIALTPETVARLSVHENIVGMKDSSGDVLSFARTRELARSGFVMLTGHGSAFYHALAAGAHGAILAVACVVPQLAVDLYEAYAAGNHQRAIELQGRLSPLARVVTTGYGIGGLKYALELHGYAGGAAVRAPLHTPNAAGREEIERVLANTLRASGGDGRHLIKQMAGDANLARAGANT